MPDWCTERELGYLEGLIDGEGEIALSKQKSRCKKGYPCYIPRVAIYNTNEEVMKHIQKVLNGGTFAPLKYANWESEWKTEYRYLMTRPLMRTVLPEMNLIIKEKQRLLLVDALEILEYRQYRHLGDYSMDVLEAIYQDMKVLNKRGRRKD